MSTADRIAGGEKNLRYLLLDEIVEKFQSNDEEEDKINDMIRLLKRNMNSYLNFADCLLQNELISSCDRDDFNHHYIGVADGFVLVMQVYLKEAHNKTPGQIYSDIDKNFSVIGEVKLPLMFNHLREISRKKQVEYSGLLQEFERFFE